MRPLLRRLCFACLWAALALACVLLLAPPWRALGAEGLVSMLLEMFPLVLVLPILGWWMPAIAPEHLLLLDGLLLAAWLLALAHNRVPVQPVEPPAC